MKDKKKVGFVKRIAAGVFALMLVVGCFRSEAYYALSSDDWYNRYMSNQSYLVKHTPNYEYTLPLEYLHSYSHLLVLCDSSNVIWAVFSNEPLLFKQSASSSRCTTYFEFANTSYSNFVFYKSSDGSSWSKEKWSQATFGNVSFENSRWTSLYSYVGSNYDILSEYNGEIVFNKTMNFDGSSLDVYNSALGYLQNVTSKRMNIHNDEDNYQSKYKFSFDTTSSTGVDLTSGDYVVRLYEQTSIYIDNIWQPFDTPKVHIGDFDASSGSLSFNISEALVKTDAETGEIDGYNFLTIALNNYVRADTYWLQIFNKETGEYGGFVQMKNNPKLPGQFTTSTVHGADDDISGTNGTDTGGYVDKIVDTNIGSGTNYEDAELNADKGDFGDSGELVAQLNAIVSSVTVVPEIFRRLFSFLPDWCLNFLGISVGLGSLLILWKIGRG